MANIVLLTGKALKSAIAGYGKTVATFAAREHQLAASALAHLDQHNDVMYVQTIYDATPANYKGSMRKWFVEFGKCTSKEEGGKIVFAYAKGKESNLAGAMEIAPSAFAKASAERAPAAYNEEKHLAGIVTYLKAQIEKMEEGKASPNTMKTLEGFIRLLDKPAKAAPVKVVASTELPKAAKTAKPAKAAKPAKVATESGESVAA